MKPFVITGTGRSGTGYTAKVLRNIGINCGHENVFNIKGVSMDFSQYDGDSSWLSAPFLSEFQQRVPKGCVFHQVRHPLKCINSMYINGRYQRSPGHPHYKYDVFKNKYVPAEKDIITTLVKFYVNWNKMCMDADPLLTWRIEDFNQSTVNTICHAISFNPEDRPFTNISKTYNHRQSGKKITTLKQIPDSIYKERLIDLSQTLGYSI